jgi:uncharacterized membrane protein
MITQNKRLIGIVLTAALLLLIPLIAMQFTIQHRVAICVTLLAVLFIIWAELAVGIFGTPFGGQ